MSDSEQFLPVPGEAPATGEPANGRTPTPLPDAVDLARAAAVEVAGDPSAVGAHLGVSQETISSDLPDVPAEELGELVTHHFAAALPGYVGWSWSVTLAGVPGEGRPTLDEVVLLPGEEALLAPQWLPWHERLRPGDLSVGDVLPATEDDDRLVPTYLAGDESADDPAGRVVAEEIGIGRERVLSARGRSEAVTRWSEGDFGPESPMARQAPGHCGSCGFFLPLAGVLRLAVGVCSNAFAPADGRAVPVGYGCGAHSQASLGPADAQGAEVVHTARYDTADFDVL